MAGEPKGHRYRVSEERNEPFALGERHSQREAAINRDGDLTTGEGFGFKQGHAPPTDNNLVTLERTDELDRRQESFRLHKSPRYAPLGQRPRIS
ncbi:MAG: hypothetical protein M3345_04280 [Actinomycetota bacterium]|nr:hypothetical protein [Actinomycetota bacterium]